METRTVTLANRGGATVEVEARRPLLDTLREQGVEAIAVNVAKRGEREEKGDAVKVAATRKRRSPLCLPL